jgi:hypothetical protein
MSPKYNPSSNKQAAPKLYMDYVLTTLPTTCMTIYGLITTCAVCFLNDLIIISADERQELSLCLYTVSERERERERERESPI